MKWLEKASILLRLAFDPLRSACSQNLLCTALAYPGKIARGEVAADAK